MKGGPMLLFGDTTPMPTPTMTVNPDSVTPGFVGFALMVVLVAIVILLVWDMNRRIRRVRYREEVRDELDAEQAALDGHDGGTPEDPDEAPADRDPHD